ncbi:hypothetical protein AX17_006113 [Amanita inopinata Kibby_2008]|nr:hypothetical protein AX17_006113 [Amanita inopinata Kibby_2008]
MTRLELPLAKDVIKAFEGIVFSGSMCIPLQMEKIPEDSVSAHFLSELVPATLDAIASRHNVPKSRRPWPNKNFSDILISRLTYTKQFHLMASIIVLKLILRSTENIYRLQGEKNWAVQKLQRVVRVNHLDVMYMWIIRTVCAEDKTTFCLTMVRINQFAVKAEVKPNDSLFQSILGIEKKELQERCFALYPFINVYTQGNETLYLVNEPFPYHLFMPPSPFKNLWDASELTITCLTLKSGWLKNGQRKTHQWEVIPDMFWAQTLTQCDKSCELLEILHSMDPDEWQIEMGAARQVFLYTRRVNQLSRRWLEYYTKLRISGRTRIYKMESIVISFNDF